MNDTLDQMLAIAREAAVEIMAVYDKPFSVDYKAPRDPVTEADRRANSLICERLSRAFPGVPIVAEESPPEDWKGYRDSERVFFVDPVDGTREFVAKNGQFVVMIGLLEGDRPTHGALYAPAQRKAWGGVVGEGAFKIEADGTRRKLPRLQATELTSARLVSSRSHTTALNEQAIKLLNPGEVVPIGSAGLKVAAVADGEADIYLAPEFAGCRWDSCAPEALLRAVGGVFTDAHGALIDYRAMALENNRGAVAAASALHEQVVDKLHELIG